MCMKSNADIPATHNTDIIAYVDDAVILNRHIDSYLASARL